MLSAAQNGPNTSLYSSLFTSLLHIQLQDSLSQQFNAHFLFSPLLIVYYGAFMEMGQRNGTPLLLISAQFLELLPNPSSLQIFQSLEVSVFLRLNKKFSDQSREWSFLGAFQFSSWWLGQLPYTSSVPPKVWMLLSLVFIFLSL